MGSRRRSEALRGATQLRSPPSSSQTQATVLTKGSSGHSTHDVQQDTDQSSHSSQSPRNTLSPLADSQEEIGLRNMNTAARYTLLESALRHRKTLMEAACGLESDVVYYSLIMADFTKADGRTFRSATKAKEILRKLTELKKPERRLARPVSRCRKLLLVRDIKMCRARLLSLVTKASEKRLKKGLTSDCVDVEDVEAVNAALFSEMFLKLNDKATKNCYKRGPARASVSDSSDESGEEQSLQSEGLFTPGCSTASSSVAQTPITSVETDHEGIMSPRARLRRLHNWEETVLSRKGVIQRDGSRQPSVETHDSCVQHEGVVSFSQASTPASRRLKTRSETGLFVTQSPITPAESRDPATSRRIKKSPSSRLHDQASQLSLSVDPESGPSTSRTPTLQRGSSRRRHKNRYRSSKSTQPETPCPADASDRSQQSQQSSTVPDTRAASVVLGHDHIDDHLGESPAAQSQSNMESRPRTPLGQANGPSVDISGSVDDPFATPFIPPRIDDSTDIVRPRTERATPALPVRSLPQLSSRSANIGMLVEENQQFSKSRSKGPACAIVGAEMSGFAREPRLEPLRPSLPSRTQHTYFDLDAGPASTGRLDRTATEPESPPKMPFRNPLDFQFRAETDKSARTIFTAPRRSPRSGLQQSSQEDSTSALSHSPPQTSASRQQQSAPRTAPSRTSSRTDPSQPKDSRASGTSNPFRSTPSSPNTRQNPADSRQSGERQTRSSSGNWQSGNPSIPTGPRTRYQTPRNQPPAVRRWDERHGDGASNNNNTNTRPQERTFTTLPSIPPHHSLPVRPSRRPSKRGETAPPAGGRAAGPAGRGRHASPRHARAADADGRAAERAHLVAHRRATGRDHGA
ncbi:protein phosphatase 1 regulatory inhibitor subunit 16B [Microdochium nivale]|nr:protein phosphatase 1 regulatory inhibitor subunit 16B [Microdochium nivale]